MVSESDLGDIASQIIIPAVTAMQKVIPLSFPSHAPLEVHPGAVVNASDLEESDKYLEPLRAK